jgi:hypothetical protein
MASIVLRSENSLTQAAAIGAGLIATESCCPEIIQLDTSILPVDKAVENLVGKM